MEFGHFLTLEPTPASPPSPWPLRTRSSKPLQTLEIEVEYLAIVK